MSYRCVHFIHHTCALILRLILQQIFKDATLFVLQETPNLVTVIPAMDHNDKFLTTSSDGSHRFSIAVHAALAIGQKAMNRYYNRTDHSDIYQIAMGIFFFY